ncbi:MAG TPA: exodeoxyribonuclease VII large subunit [Candidatus Saccharimonadales bacterium]|nr:exodeoxyribonuclease VII large subunit [Candidatus Saccharimonadales bacterium]
MPIEPAAGAEIGAEVVLGVSDFVAVLNQTLDFAYPQVTIMGELANLRISKGRWLYFDLKDEISTVKFFGTVRQLPGPLEDGMMLRVRGAPRLHHLYGFSVNVLDIRPAGEGTIKRAAQLLRAKLAAEGLFDESRKRRLPYPPARIGLIASKQSAAYADFIKVLNGRWQGITVDVIDVQVQGELALPQLVAAVEQFNGQAEPPEVLVMVRGGGSAEDLAAFSSEAVSRAVAGSRVPTLVAIGHETDTALAELAADQRASTPSNAAELLVPDRRQVAADLHRETARLEDQITSLVRAERNNLRHQSDMLSRQLKTLLTGAATQLTSRQQLLEALNPETILRRGYAIVRLARGGKPLRSSRHLATGAIVDIQLTDGRFSAVVAGSEQEKNHV